MTKFLKGECHACGGHIEFPAEAAGTTNDCPHCGKPTELLLAAPAQQSSVPFKTIVFTLAAILILVVGLAIVIIALKRAERMVAQRLPDAPPVSTQKAATPPPMDPITKAGFVASTVTIEKVQGSSLMYAVGTIRNTTNRQRFGVRVELELFDDAGNKIGEAKDYQAVIEPNAEWRFRATILEKKAVSAKLVSVNEDQ